MRETYNKYINVKPFMLETYNINKPFMHKQKAFNA